jgi:hypothetical protein
MLGECGGAPMRYRRSEWMLLPEATFNFDYSRQPFGSAAHWVGVAPGSLEGQPPGMGGN